MTDLSQRIMDELPADVIRLVIAAREAWELLGEYREDYNSDTADELDKALEAFSRRVPYENEPKACETCFTPPDTLQMKSAHSKEGLSNV